MIQFNNVNKHYGTQQVLKNINLQINKSSVTVVCGPSGSGKSTLVKTINGLEDIQSGKVFVDKQDITLVEPVSLRKKVGIVFQDFALFANKTVLQNIMAPQTLVLKLDQAQAQAEAAKLIKSMGLTGHESKYPSQLSGGQQQRVAIARALAMNPDYLIFDEPTSALDPEKVSDALDLIEDLASKGMTMIVVTHEMAFAKKISTRVVFMNNGAVEEDSPTEAFFNQPKSEAAKRFLSKVLR